VRWRAPWTAVTEETGAALDRQLQLELAAGHILEHRRARAIGRRTDNDDVAFWLDDGPEVAVVHLTWRKGPEVSPNWPDALLYKGLPEFVVHCMEADAQAYGGGRLNSFQESRAVPPLGSGSKGATHPMPDQPPAGPTPPQRLSQLILSLWVPQAIHAAAELGIADVLSEKALTSRDVAEKLGTHADATERLMRALRTLGVLAENEGRFELTELGRCLETRSPTSRRAWCRLMGSPDVWGSWGHLVDCVRTGKMAWGFRTGVDSPGADPFDTMAQNPDMADIFHRAMVELTSGVAAGIARAVDWSGARRVVDVGGGHGALLCGVLEAHPELEGSVFDLEHARAGALELFATRGLSSRASYVVGDVFAGPPPAADAFLLKSVIHDWDDERSLRILGQCREVMDGQARLLLVESPAPTGPGNPLLEWFLTFSDLNMLVNTGGRERTEAEYKGLLERARLRVTAVRETPSFFRVFEAVRA
jgi:hypothetical protein